MTGVRLYDRRMQIAVVDEKGKGIDVAGLRCRFTVRQFENKYPNTCDVHIVNLSKTTAERMTKEFTRVQISAGYEGQYGVIFDGTILQARRGRDSGVDTYCHIVAADADTAHNYAVVNTTLAAGSTAKDHHQVVLRAMNPYGVVQGHTDDQALATNALPRGKVMFGMARNAMSDIAKSTNTRWSVQQGSMQVLSRDGYLPNEAVEINRTSGMIGLPTIAPDGIYVRTLLNPLLRVNGLVKLNNASVQNIRMTPQIGGVADPGFGTISSAAKQGPEDGDGLYVVLAIDYLGDTFGNDWYSDICCISSAQGGTAASVGRGRVAPMVDVVPLANDGRRDKG
jgi:hypothetical protein